MTYVSTAVDIEREQFRTVNETITLSAYFKKWKD